MEPPSDNAWRLIEYLLERGVPVGIVLRPDGDPGGPPVTLRLAGRPDFGGDSFKEAAIALGRSKCWEEPLPKVEDEVPPADRSGPRKSVRVDDVLGVVAKVAGQFGRPFRADEVADHLWVHPSAAAAALRKLDWPRLPDKVRAVVDGREFAVYVYAPKGP